jgi:hypothetical protein
MLRAVTAAGPGSSIGHRGGGHVLPRVACAVVAVCGALAGYSSPARASGVDGGDRATTSAYLTARYQYARAVAANSATSAQVLRRFIGALGGECAGVLDGAPGQLEELFSSTGPEPPRSRGRRAAHQQQLNTVLAEIFTGEFDTVYVSDRGPVKALIAAEERLHWSDGRLAALASEQIAHTRESLTSVEPAAAVCADLRTWRASGFRVAPPAARELYERLRSTETSPLALESLDEAVQHLETPRERALARRTDVLLASALEGSDTVEATGVHLQRTLGLRDRPLEEHEHDDVPAAHGTSAAGYSYTVTTQLDARSHRVGCSLETSVSFAPPRQSGQLVVLTGGGGRNVCLRGRDARQPPVVECEEGLLRIATTVARSIRAVRLVLSDGRTVTSHTQFVAARAGGPVRIYVQAVRGPSPIPVSLTELNAHGRAIKALALAPVRNCRRPKPPSPPILVTLARATAANGRAFAIVGSLFDYGGDSEGEGAHFSLALRGGPLADTEEVDIEPDRGPLSFQVAAECPPNPYVIVYGLAKAPAVSVLAQTPGGSQPLTRVAIPSRLHAHGALVYGVLPTLPTGLLVEGRNGRVLRRIDLSRRGGEAAEFCEGYAEA